MRKKIRDGGQVCRTLVVCAAVVLAAASVAAHAGPALGRNLAGELIDADTLRGRVVVTFYWSTRCAVCMDKWPELRANARGWAGRPFTVVAVNVDDEAVWRDYERAVALVQPHARNVLSLHGGVRVMRLPSTVAIDASGKEVARVAGRVPADIWDELALLLP